MATLAWRNDADGFAFQNSWTFDAAERTALTGLATGLVPVAVGAVAAVIPDPFLVGTLTGVALAAAQYPAAGTLPGYGMCGGMAYVALDHWKAGVPIARGANSGDQPARTATASAALRNSIWLRLLDSLGPGEVLKRTIEWSLLLNQVPKEFSGGAEGLKNRTLAEWDLLRSRIDAGSPCPIGLIDSNTDIWYQHQILVFGYENTSPGTGVLLVYDNNSPFQFGQTGLERIHLDFRGSTLVSSRSALAGFFCSNYVQAPPLGMAKAYGEFLRQPDRALRTGRLTCQRPPDREHVRDIDGTAARWRAVP
jgi:hypothetical protein